MSDGGPNDDWQRDLKNAYANNRWFQRARKIAIAIGDDADRDVLEELVGNIEAVVQANDLDTLKSLIVEVSASASMLAGQSRMAGDEADGGAILNNALTEVERASVTTPAADTDSNDDWSEEDWI